MAEAELVVSGEVVLSEADLAAAMRHLPEFGRRWLAFVVALLVMPFVALSSHLDQFTLVPVLACAVLFLVFQQRLRRQWPKRALGDLGAGPTTFRFDDFGFSASSSLRQHRLAWSSLARYVETPEAFAIYTTPRTLLLVPKRAFSPVQAAQVSELLKTRVIAKPGSPSPRAALTRVLLVWLALVVSFLVIWFLLDQPAQGGDRAPRSPASSDSGPRF